MPKPELTKSSFNPVFFEFREDLPPYRCFQCHRTPHSYWVDGNKIRFCTICFDRAKKGDVKECRICQSIQRVWHDFDPSWGDLSLTFGDQTKFIALKKAKLSYPDDYKGNACIACYHKYFVVRKRKSSVPIPKPPSKHLKIDSEQEKVLPAGLKYDGFISLETISLVKEHLVV